MTIDKNNRQIGYLLGQLFFVYDKLKEDESDKRTNRRDAFFAAFSTRPLTVFARMNNLAGFDQKKLYRSKQTRGIAISASNKISKIISLIGKPETNIPLQLSIEQQAWFVLGYYHQREEPSTSNKEKESIDEIAT